jgi:two-component system chemotaxis response regulator CheY
MANILAVDDQRVMREMVKMVIEQMGHTITVAVDGVDALEKIREESFDLIISDLNMPNMGGISLVSKIKRLDEYKFTPILMLTTESSSYKKEKAKGLGASGWLTKPFDPARLQKAVEKLLSK